MEAPLRAALCITTIPSGGVDCIDQGPGLGAVGDHQFTEAGLVHLAGGQSLVEAAVGPAELGFEAESGH